MSPLHTTTYLRSGRCPLESQEGDGGMGVRTISDGKLDYFTNRLEAWGVGKMLRRQSGYLTDIWDSWELVDGRKARGGSECKRGDGDGKAGQMIQGHDAGLRRSHRLDATMLDGVPET